jgi:predicted nuclease of restriction endonuclease-like (RecB) superfamily
MRNLIMTKNDLPVVHSENAASKGEYELYKRVVSYLTTARQNVVRSVHTEMLAAYWNIGREIVEEEQKGSKRAEYGKAVLEHLSQQLIAEFGSGYGISTLRDMRQFYLIYSTTNESSPIHHTVCGESGIPINNALSWSHYRLLMRIQPPESRSFYEIESVDNAWSVRELERQVNSLLFERLSKSKDKDGLLALAHKGQEIVRPNDVVKDPMVLEFMGFPETHQLVESEFEQNLINNLQHFLLELGKGFAFVSRQKRLTLNGDHFYADLVFYHTILKCYFICDIKTKKLTHGDLGQMQLYVNYFDREVAIEGDNPTIGLILCAEKNDAMVQYTLGEKNQTIFASKYQFHLPTIKQLEDELKRELRFLKDQD